MKNISAKDQKIFEDMKQCIQDMGLKVLDEKSEEGSLTGFSVFEYEAYNMGVIFSYYPSNNAVEVLMRYKDLPADRLPVLYELLNQINGNLAFNHFFITPGTRILVLRSGIFVNGYFLDKEMFKRIIVQSFGAGHSFMPLIGKAISTGQTAQSIMDEFLATNDDVSEGFLWPDGKLKEAKMTKKYPFTIEVCSNMPAFPTHTHGLTELGMPEFLMDHLCIGPVGNASIINLSYEYFAKAKNAKKLNALKSGQTIRLIFSDLKPEAKNETIPDPDRVYCYRRVYPEFEMVKQAYNIDVQNNQSDANPEAWFVQIYVKGDDFALTDDYYKGGISW